MLQASGSAASSVVVCPVCGKQLSGRNGKQKLQYHMLTHTGEKPFQCPYCSYRAALKFNLVSHIKNIHKLPASARSFPSPPMSRLSNTSPGPHGHQPSPVSAGSLLLLLGSQHRSSSMDYPPMSMSGSSLDATMRSPPPRPASTPRSHNMDDATLYQNINNSSNSGSPS